jgi:hypothetical protein
MNTRQSVAIQMLGEREKLNHAKTQGNIDLLLELIHSDELLVTNTATNNKDLKM